jgi:hypothetical protein
MRNFCSTLICFILSFGTTQAQNGINFNETTHNFGPITEKGGKVNYEFILSNDTNTPLLINDIITSCGCTMPKWTKKPIEPGKTGVINVTFNPWGRIGPFLKVISIYTNQSTTPFRLAIEGKVIAEKSKMSVPVEQIYPVEFENYLLKNQKLNFGQIDIGESKTLRLEVYNNSEKEMIQKVKNLAQYLTVVFKPNAIPAKTAAAIEVTFNAQTYGSIKDEFIVNVDGESVPISYSAVVVDNFEKWTSTKKDNAGRIEANASEINFGNFASGNIRTLKISNTGKSTLHIRNIQLSNPLISTSQTNFNVNPGAVAEVKVHINSQRISTDLKSTLTIISDDPTQPKLEILITAKKTDDRTSRK